MTKTCPKCGYTRSAADHAPAWQCPGCGIAYDKYEASQRKARPGSLRGTTPASGNPGGGAATRFVVLLAGSLAVGYFGGWDYSKQWLLDTFGNAETETAPVAPQAVLELLALECRQREDLPLVEVVGTVRNLTDRRLNVFVNVELRTDDDQLVDIGQAFLERTPLSAHNTSDFKALVRYGASADKCAVRFTDPQRHELVHTDATGPA